MKGCVLVTGAAGFIGSHTVEMLLGYGHRVIGIDNFNDIIYEPAIKRKNLLEVEQTAQRTGGSYSFVEGDIRDPQFLESLFANNAITTVIHLAACAGVRLSIEHPMLYADVNINGTLRLLECMKDHGVTRHVFASSSSVYGNNKKVPFSESDPVDWAISPYAATKKAGEVLCYTYHHLYNISTACLRFFTVYGPRQRPDLAIHKFTRLIETDQPIPMYGDGSMRRDHTYIDDILDGIYKAFLWTENQNVYDIFNLGESHSIKLLDLIGVISRTLGKEPVIQQLPVPPGDVEQTYADITHAKDILGYAPTTDIEEGIRKFITWYKVER